MRVKRKLWRKTMAPARFGASTRLAARLAASARSTREKNSDAGRKERSQMREKNEDERKDEIKERERKSERIYERENPVNKQIIKNFGIDVRIVSYLRQYCNMLQNFDTFKTPHET